MTTQEAVPERRFAIQTFAPGWGASVMGTGVLSVMFSALANSQLLPEVTGPAARGFLVVAILVALPVLGLTAAKWIRYPATVFADLSHPVKGGMSATFPGGLLVLAVAIGRSGEWLFGSQLAPILVGVLTALGGFLVLLVGPDPLHRELLWLSWVFLGIGAMLYVVVVAALFFRSATAPLPPAPLAPSLFIGMGPAGLIGLNLVLLAEASARLGTGGDTLIAAALAAGIAMWGFGLWWGVTALVVLIWGYRKLPFALSWWGFTFPLGAWVVAGLVLAHASGSLLVGFISVVGAAVLLAVWALVLVRTLMGVVRGTIWE